MNKDYIIQELLDVIERGGLSDRRTTLIKEILMAQKTLEALKREFFNSSRPIKATKPQAIAY